MKQVSYTQRFFAVLELLKKQTGEMCRMTSTEIASKLMQQGIKMDPRSITRAIGEMVQAGYPIINMDGYYYRLLFSHGEIEYLLHAVEFGSGLTWEQRACLTEKLCEIGGAQRGLRTECLKPANPDFEMHLAILRDAIAAERQIAFHYGFYDVDKQLHPRLNRVHRIKGNIVTAFKLPSFMRDWVMKRFQDDDGQLDIEEASDFIRTFIPKKNEWKSIQNRIVTLGEQVRFLGRLSVNIDIKSQEVSFALPDFGIGYTETYISMDVWERCSEDLLRSEEAWGIIELGYLYPSGDKKNGRIQLLGFRDFCPYVIDLDEFKDARAMFTLEEWIDIVLAAVDYNPCGYESMAQKLAVLQRLLPFVEKNLNLIELAPPGTGKSYLFGQVSRYGWLVSGKATRAQLIYNRAKKRDGVVAYKDFVALDEIREADYMKDTEMHSALQQIMENKKYKSDDGHEVNVDAGIVFLGNIAGENMNEYSNMFVELPEPFHPPSCQFEQSNAQPHVSIL